MHAVSTRDPTHRVLPSEAFIRGLAPDGGLYVPERLPLTASAREPRSLAEDACEFLGPFLEGDPLEPQLSSICREAFSFPCPLRALGQNDDRLLELFHGPTAAFKDYGARFLAACLRRLPPADERGAHAFRTVLVATSGDTGGAVAAAFAGHTETDVWILYPEGGVSPRQEAQLASWGSGVRAFSVRGTFDDCQRMVKEGFARTELKNRFRFTSANSINLGRLLPQAAYFWATAKVHHAETGRALRPIVPTGNLGHGLAAVWARACGAQIADIVLALNANRGLLDLLETGELPGRPALRTIANAMDVGVPSNLERLRHLFPAIEELRGAVSALSFSDEEIRTEIRSAPSSWGIVPCPHTACALLARRARPGGGFTMVATAHPAKFDSVVEPLIGETIPVPASLAEILNRPLRRTSIAPELTDLVRAAEEWSEAPLTDAVPKGSRS